MPVANHDSSYVTLRKQQAALFAYNNQLVAAQNAGTTVLREQVSNQSSYVISERKQGGCVCGEQNPYTFNPNGTAGNVVG